MSEIKVNSIKGVNSTDAAITINNSDGTCTANITNNLSNRNLIINGAMQVAQRGTSSTEPSNTYTLDRFKYFRNIDTGEVTVSQESVTDLTGFTKAAKINCTTAETGVPAKAGSKYAGFSTNLEAQNLQQLAYGTSGAKQITLSFYVKSNITGTFCVSIYKGDQTARVVSLGYTINSANTWERKTLTFPADTGGGGIDNNNGSGLQFFWILARQQGYQGTASTTWADNADSRFANLCTATIFENTNDHIFITGVQLEVGSVATDFEHRSYADELRRCQRYLYTAYQGSSYSYITGPNDQAIGAGWAYSSSEVDLVLHFPVQLRDTPTVTQANAGYSIVVKRPSGDRYIDSGGWNGQLNPGRHSTRIYATTGSSRLSGSLTEGTTYFIYLNSGSPYLRFDAEL